MMKLPPPPFLYPILDSSFSQNLLADASEAIRAGVQIFQIRMKKETREQVWQMTNDLVPMCEESKVCLVVNDYVDVVLVSDASGVHLGQDDFPAAEARKILGSRVIGLSTHNRHQFERACELPIDYVAVGPIFPTMSKDHAGAPLGVEFVRSLRSKRKPIVCIGGIGEDHISRLVKEGADGIAVISLLYKSTGIYDAVSRLQEALTGS